MSQLLGTDKQKYIASKNLVKDENGKKEYEVTLNQAVQKEVYEKIYALRAKEVEIKGFRKGEAPRSMVEGQIYNDLTNDVLNLLVNYAVDELLDEEKITTIMMPEISDVSFTLIEAPVKFVVKIQALKDYKIPDMKKHFVKVGELDASDEEIEQAMKNLWEDWQKKGAAENKEKYKEISDEWVANIMGMPDVKNVADLKKVIKEEILHNKLHQAEDKQISEALKNIIDEMKIEVPEEFVAKNTERAITQQKEQMQKYGMKWEDYLKYSKKTEDSFKEEVEKSVNAQYKEEVFWNLYIKDRKVEIDPAKSEDAIYINYAAANLRLPADKQPDQATVARVLRMAQMYKALEILRKELGIEPHNHHSHDHDHGDEDHTHDEAA
jgi:FKBP-type peptidyl-prolyl cis-trans isomerase (trigger factor)